MWELDCEESWAQKNWYFWSGVREDSCESLGLPKIQKFHSTGDRSWVFFGRNDAKVETPVLWPPHEVSCLIGKDSDAGRDWRQEEKGTTEDEMAGWHHQLDGCESKWTPGVGDGQGDLACSNSWGRKESDTTEWLIWTELILNGLLLAYMVKDLPTMWETQIQSLFWEDPLEKEMATHSNLLAWRIPWWRSLVAAVQRVTRVRCDWVTNTSTLILKEKRARSKTFTLYFCYHKNLSCVHSVQKLPN